MRCADVAVGSILIAACAFCVGCGASWGKGRGEPPSKPEQPKVKDDNIRAIRDLLARDEGTSELATRL